MAALHTPLYFHFVHCADAPRDGRVGMAMRRLGLERLAVCPVAHSFDAWAIALLHREGWSIVYSGDTQPCEGVVQLGRRHRASETRALVLGVGTTCPPSHTPLGAWAARSVIIGPTLTRCEARCRSIP